MRSDVVYEMRDLLKNPNLKIDFGASFNYGKREWIASIGDTYMGCSVGDDVLGTYWFDNKNINFRAVDVLKANDVPYTRG